MANSGITAGRWAHVCVDMQTMFAAETECYAPWIMAAAPAVEAIVERDPARTVFTRFIPPFSPEQAPGAWQSYYDRWGSMTRQYLPIELLQLLPPLARFVPPARVLDKTIYSPWLLGGLHRMLRAAVVDTLIITGGETDVCVLATVMGAIDLGYRVILPTDAVYGSADATHDAMLSIYRSRFGQQLTTCTTQDVLDLWPAEA